MPTHVPFRSTILAAMTAAAFVAVPLAGCAEKDQEELAREESDRNTRQEIRGTIVRMDTKDRVASIEVEPVDATRGKDATARHSSDIRLDSKAVVSIDGKRRDFADLKAGDRIIAYTVEPMPAARSDGRVAAVNVTEIHVYRDQQVPGRVDRDQSGRMSKDGRDRQGEPMDQQRRDRDTPANRNPASGEEGQDLEWKKRVDTPKTPVGE